MKKQLSNINVGICIHEKDLSFIGDINENDIKKHLIDQLCSFLLERKDAIPLNPCIKEGELYKWFMNVDITFNE